MTDMPERPDRAETPKSGQPLAADNLLPLVYEELKRVAARYLGAAHG